MKKILQSMLCLLLVINSYGQDISLRWAEKIKTKGQVSILGGKNGQFYTTHTNNNDELVGRIYDETMNFTNEKIINFNLDKKSYTYDGAYFIKNKIFHFIKEVKRKEDKTFLYVATSNNKLETDKAIKVIDEAHDDDKARKFGSVNISPDSTKVVVYHEKVSRKKEPNIISYKVYNSEFDKVLNEGAKSLPIKAKNFSTENIDVDNFGNVYVLAKISKEGSEKEKGLSNYYYKMIVFAIDNSVKQFDFDYKDNNISYIDLIPGKNNTFFCTGFLTNLKGGKKKLISDEMFFASFDCNSLTLSESKMLKVPGLYPDEIKKAEDYIPYRIKEIFEKKDGGYSIVSEQYKYISVTMTGTNGTTSTRDYYYYCDIVCVQTNKSVDVQSVTRIPKYQLNASNPSIIATIKDDVTYIVYEDLTKNAEAENDKKTKRSTKTMFSSNSKNSLYLLTIQPDGQMKKDIVYDYKDSKIQPYILGSLVAHEGLILLNANDQLGILEIK